MLSTLMIAGSQETAHHLSAREPKSNAAGSQAARIASNIVTEPPDSRTSTNLKGSSEKAQVTTERHGTQM